MHLIRKYFAHQLRNGERAITESGDVGLVAPGENSTIEGNKEDSNLGFLLPNKCRSS